jgi:hypothetical protein
MFPIPKEQILLIRRDELIPCIFGCTPNFADLCKAETVKFVSFRVVGAVLIYSVGWDFDADSLWNVLTIGEGDPFEDFASERCCICKSYLLHGRLIEVRTEAQSVKANCLLHEAVELNHRMERARCNNPIIVCHCSFDLLA